MRLASDLNLKNETAAKADAGALETFDVAVVGAGFSGLYMLHKARRMGLAAVVFETGDDVGGTWYWNRYPGARCDVESLFYSYSFDRKLAAEWDWTERYAAQPEILEYARHVCERYGLRPFIRFNSKISSVDFIDSDNVWRLETASGEAVLAQFVVMATGPLSVPKKPHFKGEERFRGEMYHTGLWPHHDVSFDGKRVAVIGSGASGIQAATAVSPVAGSLHVFQRGAHYSIPAWNRPLTDEDRAGFRENFEDLMAQRRQSFMGIILDTNPATFRKGCNLSAEDRHAQLESRWNQGGLLFNMAFSDTTLNAETNFEIAEFVRNKIRSIVRDPETADTLCSMHFPIGTKRTCVDTGYYEIYNRPNVHLVDTRKTPIREFTDDGLVAGDREHAFDIVIVATGFDAMTGALLAAGITGRGGRKLADEWKDGASTYLGLAMSGFPNLFTITGPGSPSVFTNMFVSFELHVEWITDCIGYMRRRNHRRIEADRHAQDNWTSGVAELVEDTLYPQADSWWIGANIAGKPRRFLAFTAGHKDYSDICRNVMETGYTGFNLN